MDFRAIKSAYLIGIKGVGMTALAQVLKKRGVAVSGSDTAEKFFTDDILTKNRIPFFNGFSAAHIRPETAEVFISSSAYLGTATVKKSFTGGVTTNAEVQAVLAAHLPLVSYAQAVGGLMTGNVGIAVCGSHGKSSTTAMLGVILQHARKDPTVIVGTEVLDWHANGRAGQSRYIVVEADEYRDAFLHYSPKIAIITAISYDHPDYFPSPRSYLRAFERFAARVPHDGVIIANADDENVRAVLRSKKIEATIQYFSPAEHPVRLATRFPEHPYYANALAAYYAARALHIPTATILSTLSTFKGTKRRFERIGAYHGNLILDDYAHHPDEVAATLKGLREKFPTKKIALIFQPHTFSRTAALLDDFAQALSLADDTFIFPIYGSAREMSGTVSAADLIYAIQKYGGQAVAAEHKTIRALIQKLAPRQWVIVTMGASDIWKIGKELVATTTSTS